MVCCAAMNQFDGDSSRTSAERQGQPGGSPAHDARDPEQPGSSKSGPTLDDSRPLWKRVASRISKLVIAACRGPLVC
jgi:hypothetical protein